MGSLEIRDIRRPVDQCFESEGQVGQETIWSSASVLHVQGDGDIKLDNLRSSRVDPCPAVAHDVSVDLRPVIPPFLLRCWAGHPMSIFGSALAILRRRLFSVGPESIMFLNQPSAAIAVTPIQSRSLTSRFMTGPARILRKKFSHILEPGLPPVDVPFPRASAPPR